MQLIETKIQNIYESNNYVTYLFTVDCKTGYTFSAVNYSKERDFMSNAFGASNDLKLGKKAYLTLTSDNKIISISNEIGETIVTTLTYDQYNGVINTHNKDYILKEYNQTIEEYTLLIRNTINGKKLIKKI